MNLKTDYEPGQWVYIISDFNGEHDGPVLPVKILSVKVMVEEDPKIKDPKIEYRVLVKEEEKIYDQNELMDSEEAKRTLGRMMSEYITSKARECFPHFYCLLEKLTVTHKDPDD